MPAAPFPVHVPFFVVETFIWLVGLALLGIHRFGPARHSKPALGFWPVSLEAILTATLIVFASVWLVTCIPAVLSNNILGRAAYERDWRLALEACFFQLGLLVGALGAGIFLRTHLSQRFASLPPKPAHKPSLVRHPSALLSGVGVCLMSIPLVYAIGFLWKFILKQLGVSTPEQPMIDVFRNADDPLFLVWIVVSAAVLAPLSEELLFRAGFFHYLHTRVSRPFALAAPALVFALLHGNVAASVPLFALGVFFAIAYERTGRIAVPMIAHSLFNFHTIAQALYGS